MREEEIERLKVERDIYLSALEYIAKRGFNIACFIAIEAIKKARELNEDETLLS